MKTGSVLFKLVLPLAGILLLIKGIGFAIDVLYTDNSGELGIQIKANTKQLQEALKICCQ